MTKNQPNLVRLLPFVLFIFSLLVAPRSKAAPLCDVSSLPQNIQAKLATDYPDWQPETLERLWRRDRVGWLKEHPNSCPGIVIGHFESNAYLSYAFFLVSKPEKKRAGFHVVVLSRTEDSAQISSHVVFESEEREFISRTGLAIAKARPGQYTELDEDSDKPRQITMHLDGVFYEAIGVASTLYYWDHGHYAALPLSD